MVIRKNRIDARQGDRRKSTVRILLVSLALIVTGYLVISQIFLAAA